LTLQALTTDGLVMFKWWRV